MRRIESWRSQSRRVSTLSCLEAEGLGHLRGSSWAVFQLGFCITRTALYLL
jgi:hypothetical protein